MLAVLSCLSACAYSTKKIVRQLGIEKAEGNLAKLKPDLPKVRELEDQIYFASFTMAKGLVDGGVAALSEPERDAAVGKAADELTRKIAEMSEAAGAGVGEGLRVEIELLVSNLIDQMFAAGGRIDIERAAGRITARVIDTLSERLAVGLREQIGPAAGDMIRDHIGPALGDTLEKDIDPRLGAMVKNVSAQAVYGFDQAITEVLDKRRADGKLDIFEKLREVFREGEGLAKWLLIVVIVTFTGIGILLVLWFRAAGTGLVADRAAKLRQSTLERVVEAIHEAGEENPEAIKPLRARIKRMRDVHHDEYTEINRIIAKQQKWLPPRTR